MKAIKVKLRDFLHRPQVTVCIGFLVCVCGLSEMLEEVIEGYEGVLKASHGVIIFGAVTLLKGLTELAEGIELVTVDIEEAKREEAEGTRYSKV